QEVAGVGHHRGEGLELVELVHGVLPVCGSRIDPAKKLLHSISRNLVTQRLAAFSTGAGLETPQMSFDLVFFGGTGDLTWRKLMPALFQAFRHGKLPEGGRILAVARDDQTDERYREWLKERFREVDGAKRPNDEEFERFA